MGKMGLFKKQKNIPVEIIRVVVTKLWMWGLAGKSGRENMTRSHVPAFSDVQRSWQDLDFRSESAQDRTVKSFVAFFSHGMFGFCVITWPGVLQFQARLGMLQKCYHPDRIANFV